MNKNKSLMNNTATPHPISNRYRFNPHKHVKIWLSKNPDLFLNLENQIRLIQMREQNPKDKIYLVYDSSLLTTSSLEELYLFCQENQFCWYDAHGLKENLHTELEHRLYEYYLDEITHLSEGGNLAVASDILRWLSPIYRLGSYSDFDYPVNTRMLPGTVEISAPILLNIGSLKLGQKEFILSNNDFIAVADLQAAKPFIEQIQQGLIARLAVYDNDFIERTDAELQEGFINRQILKLLKNRAETYYINRSKEIYPLCSSREVRHYLNQATSNIDNYIIFHQQDHESPGDVVQRLRTQMKQQLTLTKRLFFKKDCQEINYYLRKDDVSFLNYHMKKELDLFLKSVIVCTTGPLQIANSLFGGYIFSTHHFQDYIQSFSFQTYGLQQAFQSLNSIPLQENLFGMLRFLGVDEGTLNDSSWLESGQQLQEGRIRILESKQAELHDTLPLLLQETKAELEHLLMRLNQSMSHSMEYEVVKHALENILRCFQKSSQGVEFNIAAFRTVPQVMTNKKVHEPLQQLRNKLEQFSHQAIIFRIAKNKKINIAQP